MNDKAPGERWMFDEGEKTKMREIIAIDVSSWKNVLVSVPHYFTEEEVRELLAPNYEIAIIC